MPGAVAENMKRCFEIASRIENPGLVVLPELSNIGYGFKTRAELYSLSENIPNGVTTELLLSASKALKCTLVAGIAERSEERIYNSAVIASKGSFVGSYRKRHLYGKENDFFSTGAALGKIYDLGRFRLAVQICLDIGFTEELIQLSDAGADVIAHPANLFLPISKEPHTIKPKRNNSYVVSSNRIGTELVFGTLRTFSGQSMILAPPDTHIATLASPDKEEALSLEIDLASRQHLTTIGS